jgi:K+-sensing histidine kinase KdpD
MTRQLDTLYQTVSHEMRTPLNGIQQAVSQLFSLDDLSPMSRQRNKQLLKIIFFQSNLLECFVNDQLDLKMIQGGVYKQNISVFDPEKVILLVQEMFKDQANAQQTKIHFVIESEE